VRFLFEDYVLDSGPREFRRGSRPLSVQPQVFDLLEFLLRHRDRVVSRDDLLSSVWGGRIVSESTIASRINAVRRTIGDNGEQQRLIRTIIGKGIRFVGDVREHQANPETRIPPRLSVVVLPFANLSNNPELEYFADGISDDLTTDLSRIADMFVIARNTAFTYKGKHIDAKQVGRELDVRYLLEGSVRRLAQRVRVNARLVDAETGAHLWADRLDRDIGDLFCIQNDITGQIARALQFELDVADARRPTAHPDALDYILRGRAAWWKSTFRSANAEALDLFERALALDHSAVEAQIWMALMLINRMLNFRSDAPDADIQRADELIAGALVVSPNSAWAHYVKGQVLRAQSRFEDAAVEYETAIAFDRNLANAYARLGSCKLNSGCVDEVIPPVEYAIRLSPRDRNLPDFYWLIGAAHLLRARIDEAVGWLEKSRSADTGTDRIHAALAAGYALKGETERAWVALDEARRRSDRYSSIACLKATPRHGLEAPKLRALAESTYFAGLRLAGVPEE
jgi:TolB-like protein